MPEVLPLFCRVTKLTGTAPVTAETLPATASTLVEIVPVAPFGLPHLPHSASADSLSSDDGVSFGMPLGVAPNAPFLREARKTTAMITLARIPTFAELQKQSPHDVPQKRAQRKVVF